MLAESGIAYALLRNGWYTENYLASAPAALEHGVFIGAAGEGKIASATRADYAAAAARIVISEDGHAGKTYELAGDTGLDPEPVGCRGWQNRVVKKVVYQNLSEADFAAALKVWSCLQGWRLCWLTQTLAPPKVVCSTTAIR